jgi:hypothetical protein
VKALRCLDLGDWIPTEIALVDSDLGSPPRYTNLDVYPFRAG